MLNPVPVPVRVPLPVRVRVRVRVPVPVRVRVPLRLATDGSPAVVGSLAPAGSDRRDVLHAVPAGLPTVLLV